MHHSQGTFATSVCVRQTVRGLVLIVHVLDAELQNECTR
jgi:hypothetical protein